MISSISACVGQQSLGSMPVFRPYFPQRERSFARVWNCSLISVGGRPILNRARSIRERRRFRIDLYLWNVDKHRREVAKRFDRCRRWRRRCSFLQRRSFRFCWKPIEFELGRRRGTGTGRGEDNSDRIVEWTSHQRETSSTRQKTSVCSLELDRGCVMTTSTWSDLRR